MRECADDAGACLLKQESTWHQAVMGLECCAEGFSILSKNCIF